LACANKKKNQSSLLKNVAMRNKRSRGHWNSDRSVRSKDTKTKSLNMLPSTAVLKDKKIDTFQSDKYLNTTTEIIKK
jgi:hypothetical protein